MTILGPVPCQGCRKRVYWSGQGRYSFGWRDAGTGWYHECQGAKLDRAAGRQGVGRNPSAPVSLH
jgi:hypothetical protein